MFFLSSGMTEVYLQKQHMEMKIIISEWAFILPYSRFTVKVIESFSKRLWKLSACLRCMKKTGQSYENWSFLFYL